MNYPDLKPGIKALTLLHPIAYPGWVGLVVTVLSAPRVSLALTMLDGGRVIMPYLVCKIRLPSGQEMTGADNCMMIAWPAVALMPLPGDEEFKDEKLSVPVKQALKKLAEEEA